MSFAWPLALDPVGSAAVTGREPHLHPKQPLALSLQEGRPEAAPQPFWGFALCVLCLQTQKQALGTHAMHSKDPEGRGARFPMGREQQEAQSRGHLKKKGSGREQVGSQAREVSTTAPLLLSLAWTSTDEARPSFWASFSLKLDSHLCPPW